MLRYVHTVGEPSALARRHASSHNDIDPVDIPRIFLVYRGPGELTMKNFVLGIVVGIILTIIFMYFGGGRTLKSVGTMATELGERIETVEKSLKETTQDVLKKKKP